MRQLQGIDYIREKVRKRDKYTCQKCKKRWKPGTRRFDVHHLEIEMESIRSYSYDKENQDKLITLCHKCHISLPHNKTKMSVAQIQNPYRKRAIKQRIARTRKFQQLRQNGLSLAAIGKLYGISYQRVSQLLNANN
jgi:5-methylcytosine-specific restriction endonuclease McrA